MLTPFKAGMILTRLQHGVTPLAGIYLVLSCKHEQKHSAYHLTMTTLDWKGQVEKWLVIPSNWREVKL